MISKCDILWAAALLVVAIVLAKSIGMLRGL